MAIVWTTKERIDSIQRILERTPHDQIAVGAGFTLIHNPEKCSRCIANTATIEIAGFLHAIEVRTEKEVSEFIAALENFVGKSHPADVPVTDETRATLIGERE